MGIFRPFPTQKWGCAPIRIKIAQKPSPLKSNSKKQPKIYWHRNAVKNLKQNNFIYTEIPEFFEYTASIELVNNYTSHILPHLQDELPVGIFGKKKKTEKYLRQMFTGPRYNFEVRRSTLSNNLGFEIFGLFSREFIPAESIIGNYVGFQGFGADLNHENFTYSKKHFEYIYNGDRDYMDSGDKGNFLRFCNHQDAPTAEALPIFVQ